MRPETTVSLIINRPPVDVFASLTDFGKWPQWGGGNLVSMEQTSAGPLQAGSTLRQVNKVGRKPAETLVRVSHFVPNQTLGIERPDLCGTFTLEPVEAGTRLQASFEVKVTGLKALMYKLLLKQFVLSDLRKFKTMVEFG